MGKISLICLENFSKIGPFCITEEDLLIIILNLIFLSVIFFLIYKTYFYNNNSSDIISTIKHPFLCLGEGALNKYYKATGVQQKSSNTKKKSTKSNVNNEKTNINELECCYCGSSVKVTYQYTLHKLIN
jgi:hypothetical protein